MGPWWRRRQFAKRRHNESISQKARTFAPDTLFGRLVRAILVGGYARRPQLCLQTFSIARPGSLVVSASCPGGMIV